MATRERNCQFGVDEQGEKPCGECRRCCDALKLEVGQLMVEQMGLLAHIVSLKTAGAEVPSYVRVLKDGDQS